VTDESVLDLATKLAKLENSREIVLFIKSDGGDIHAGLSAMDHISLYNVTTVADGLCASSASVMLMGGKRRCMMPNSYILMHQISLSDFSGTVDEFKDEHAQLERLMHRVKMIYWENSRIPTKKLERFLKNDRVLSASKCIKYGIVHEIYSSSNSSS
jgi:ATP-dependent protease ClpP protease subunit